MPAGNTSEHYAGGIEDVVILPLVAIALVVKKVLRGLLTLLIHVIDFLFPILLNLMRLPLFTFRILGDGIAALLKGVARVLPLPSARREAWREFISQHWAWLRRKISYQAFENAVHHLFESGMAWVFRKCRTLTPGTALMVIFGAVLWLPISFGAATLLHAVLIAKATSLPAWMQLLHPAATIIAKSKLLVLPVYPAAWPQAKRHPFMTTMIEFWHQFTSRYLIRKTGYRYLRLESALAGAMETLARAVSAGRIGRFFDLLFGMLNAAATSVGRGLRAIVAGIVARLSGVPLLGTVVRRYTQHYEEATRHPTALLSDRVSGFFARWSIKFSAEYYEAKERQETTKGDVRASSSHARGGD